MQVIDFKEIIKQVQELAWLSDNLAEELIGISDLELYESREIIFQGDKDCPKMYIVISGSLQVLKKETKGESLQRVLYEKNLFGLSFLLNQSMNYESIFVATSQSLLLAIPIKESREIISKSTTISATFNALENYYPAYSFIKNSTTLGDHLNPNFLIEFVSSFELLNYKADDFVFKQGDTPDGYYICLKGHLEVIVTVNDKVVFNDRIREGDYFGELALITDSVRSGSIKAVTDASCYYLSKEIFDELVLKEPALLKGFQLLAQLAYE
ncbi:MAG: cyclic nucleotide-binding domain-containing protein [Planctomycetes bacterium]|nr:cyclic nucleotide-binding domain-containing protein [Planctomycetota bacterium]